LDAQTDEFLDPAAVLRLLDEHRSGTADHSRRIWTILVFLLWHGTFVTGDIRHLVSEPSYPLRLCAPATRPGSEPRPPAAVESRLSLFRLPRRLSSRLALAISAVLGRE